MVWRVALRMLGDPDEAEDAVQETFIRAWKTLPGYDRRYSPATWLGTMPQDSPTGPAPLSSGHIRLAAAVTGIAAAAVLVLSLSTALIQTDTAVRTEISSLPVSTSAFMRGPQAHLEHYRKTNAHRQSVAGLKDRAANLQSHEDH